MQAVVNYTIRNQNFLLHPYRAAFWVEKEWLILSDIHLGKVAHFRKEGIAVPQKIFQEDLQRLFSVIQYFKPKALIVVGDMFHSVANKELDLFAKWRQDISQIAIELVIGNHDILHKNWYANNNINIHTSYLLEGDFCFQHDVCSNMMADKYYFSGHLHPGVKIRGLGKQSLVFPCFYFNHSMAILPAFSKFTGVQLVAKEKTDNLFAIANDTIIPV